VTTLTTFVYSLSLCRTAPMPSSESLMRILKFSEVRGEK